MEIWISRLSNVFMYEYLEDKKKRSIWANEFSYSRRQYKVSVTYRLPTVPYFLKTPSETVPFYSAGRDAILLLYANRI